MKKSMMLLMLLMVNMTIFSQPRQKEGRNSSGKQTEHMKIILSLSDTQFAAVNAINDKYTARFLNLRKDTTASRENRRDAFRSLRVEKEKEIAIVLTPEQQVKWKTHEEERKEKRKGLKLQHHKNDSTDLKEKLSLTDDQQLKIQTANKILMEKRKAIRNDSTLSKEGATQQLKILKRMNETTIKGILTNEQFEKWNALKADSHGRHRKPGME